jgi:predicted Zn-dependent peptidase
VVEGQAHEATGVWSGWLDNGIRVHHRRVDSRKNEAAIVITLAGGVIEETTENRGVTEALVDAWNRAATSRLSSTEIRRLMADKKVRVGGSLGQDTVTLTVTGDPAALAEGLALAYLLLTDPVVEPAGFAQWKERRLHEIAEQASQPRAALAQAEADAFYAADEARLRPLTEPQVRKLTPASVQQWLRALIGRAPMEVVVVGDVARETATMLAARYLGALPARERIGAKVLHGLRALPRPAGPLRVARTVTTQTDQAQVLDGFFGANVQEVRESRLLILAARVLSTRMNRTLREERQLVYSIGASSRPGEAYPGFGRFVAQAPTDPAKAEALADAIEEMFAEFAAHGPTADELLVAKQQLANLLGEIISTPDFWRERLATLDYRGLSLDDLARIAADYQGFTAEEVRAAFGRYHAPASRFRLVVIPRKPGATP